MMHLPSYLLGLVTRTIFLIPAPGLKNREPLIALGSHQGEGIGEGGGVVIPCVRCTPPAADWLLHRKKTYRKRTKPHDLITGR